MTSDELREHIGRLTAADRRALRTWIARAYGIDGNPAPDSSTLTQTLPETRDSSQILAREHARRAEAAATLFAFQERERFEALPEQVLLRDLKASVEEWQHRCVACAAVALFFLLILLSNAHGWYGSDPNWGPPGP